MRYIAYISLVFLAIACSAPEVKKGTDKPRTIEQTPIEYAKRFTIHSFDSYKILSVKNKGNDEQNYILYKRGSKKPVIKLKAIFVEVPVSSVACMSSLYVGFLDRLGETGKITAVDNVDYISNKTINEKVADGKIMQLAIAGKVNEELAIACKPELMINYGSGNSQSDKNDKLYIAGIPTVYCLDHLETTPLGRAEWIKFLACFFGKEREADSLFSLTETNYAVLKNEAKKATTQPLVLTEIKLNDAWYVPGGKSFMATLIQDANAHYCWEKDTAVGSLPLSFEQVYKTGADADYWLNVLFAKTKADISKLDKRYMDFKAFKNSTIYNNNLQVTDKGGNAYWETGLICPDLILSDLVKIFHPELGKGEALNYYKRLE